MPKWIGFITSQNLQGPFQYDNEETFARMLKEELPIACAKTLTSGRWDNNDILPGEETAAQGVSLVF